MPLSVSAHQSSKTVLSGGTQIILSWTVQWLLTIEALDAITAAE
jgi:hypothetical protein